MNFVRGLKRERKGRSSQSGGADGRGEEKHTSSVSFISFRKNKNDILYLTKLPVSKFSKLQRKNIFTSNSNKIESSPDNEPRDQVGSDQRTNSKRKLKDNHGNRREYGAINKARRVIFEPE